MSIRIFLLLTVVTVCYLFSLVLGLDLSLILVKLKSMLLLKIGLALGGRALAFALLKLGLPGGLALAIGCFARVLITEEVSEIVGLRMMPTGSDSGNSGSGGWQKYLHLSSDSEGQGQGPENSEAEPASRKRGSTDPREDVGPSSVGGRLDSVNAPETSASSGWSGSWIEKWLNPGDTSSAPGDGQQPQGEGEVDQTANVMGSEAHDTMGLKKDIGEVFFQIKGRKPRDDTLRGLFEDLNLKTAYSLRVTADSIAASSS